MIPLSGKLIDSVNIHRSNRMFFIDGQIVWFAIKLTSTGKHNFNVRVFLSANFKDGKLCRSINVQICVWVSHRIQVTGLSSQIEEVVLVLYQGCNGERVTHVTDLYRNFITEIVNIELVASIMWHEAIYQSNFRLLRNQLPAKVRAYKAQTSSY